MAPASPDNWIKDDKVNNLVESLKDILKAVEIPDNETFISHAESLVEDKVQIILRGILEPYLSPKNAIGVTIFSKLCGDIDFLRYADDFVDRNLDMVIDNVSFRNLQEEDIQLYVRSTTLGKSVTTRVVSASRKFHHINPIDENEVALIAAVETALIRSVVVDDSCILEILGRVKVTSRLEIGHIFAHLVSPKNCLSIAILAKEVGDNSLASFVSAFIFENTDIILAGSPLKTMSMKNFCRFFVSYNLDDATKLRLLEGKLTYYFANIENTDAPEPLEWEHIVAFTTAVTLPLDCDRLGEFCHVTLKNSINHFNCLDIAVLANGNRLDELQIWAEYYIINNFPLIVSGISSGSYSTDQLRRYVDISSIDFVQHGLMFTNFLNYAARFDIKNRSYEGIRISLTKLKAMRGVSACFRRFNSFNASKWLLKELRKLPSRKKLLIGRSGGIIELDGCSLTFPEDALSDDTHITMTLNTNPDKHPETGMMITPLLSVEPSMSLLKPVLVKMETCYAPFSVRQVLPASVMSKTSTSEWKKEEDIELTCEYRISFYTTHFSDKIGKVCLRDTRAGRFRLRNDVFIQQETGMITSYFYCFEKDRLDIKRVMRMSNCACFNPHAVNLRGMAEDEIELEIVLHKPELSPSLILKQDAWVPDRVAIREVIENGNYQLDADPGTAVTNLAPGSFVSGKYRILCNRDPAATALVKREWPVKLDPEYREPPRNVTAGNVVLAGGIMKQDNTDCHTSIG